jgi:hypothetical protein
MKRHNLIAAAIVVGLLAQLVLLSLALSESSNPIYWRSLAGAFFFTTLAVGVRAIWTVYDLLTLVIESRQALGELKSGFQGVRDTLEQFHKDFAELEHEWAKVESKVGLEEIEKLQDRLGNLELAIGFGKPTKIKLPNS